MTKLPSSMAPEPFDPEYERLRARWHDTKGTSDHDHANRQLSDYLWAKRSRIVAEDRAKHPRARRNAPVPPRDPGDPGDPGDTSHPTRYLP